MKSITTSRKGTIFFNDFLDKYYNSDELDEFRTFSPNEGSIPDIIKDREGFPAGRRATLVKSLESQYKESGIHLSDELSASIASLAQDNTFTITTGQQIHIGLGPLYVLYKAFDTIALAEQLTVKHPGQNFIPVFWMASEDHDLEEIADVNVFGSVHTWHTDQTGPVGRMRPDGLPGLFSEIENEYRFDPVQTEFISLCKEVYLNSETLSVAFRRILHHYMGHLGLVILDADDAALKQSFVPVLADELQHKNYQSLQNKTDELVKAGVDAQLHIRECGLFDMREGSRTRVTQKYTEAEARSLASNDAYSLSPNAAFRPLYQEWILPNLIYIGGPSEIKYWMQLGSLFQNYQMEMPLLHLRTSHIHIPAKMNNQFTESKWLDMLGTREQLVEKNNAELKALVDSLNDQFKTIKEGLLDYRNKVESNFKGFSLAGKLGKIEPKLDEIETLVARQLVLKAEQNPDLNKVLKTKDKFFSQGSVQERNEHVITHATLLNFSSTDVQSHFGFEKSQKITMLFE